MASRNGKGRPRTLGSGKRTSPRKPSGKRLF